MIYKVDARITSVLMTLPVILIVAALLRGLALFFFEGDIHDGIGRVLIAQEWLNTGIPIFGRTLWPEGNYILPAFGFYFWNDAYWCPRVLYALVGLSNVWIAILLASEALGRKAGVVTGWIVALMPFHIMVSTNAAMSETPYISLILLSCWATVRYTLKPRKSLALFAGLCLTFATTFRIDGAAWGIPISATIAIANWQHRRRPSLWATDQMIFGCSGLLYLVTLIICWINIYPDNPSYILSEAKLNTQQFFVNGHHPRWSASVYQVYSVVFWPVSVFIILTPIVALLGCIGAFISAKYRNTSTIPLTLGLLVISIWLAYATFTHDILAQWRYALILAIILGMFTYTGANAISRKLPWLTVDRLTLATIAGAIATQTAVTYAAFKDFGAITRQITVISPIRPNQFSSRELLEWTQSAEFGSGKLLLTPHALEQPYLRLKLPQLPLPIAEKLVIQSYYQNQTLVYSIDSLRHALLEELRASRYVALSTSLRELGLSDGTVRELIQPKCTSKNKITDCVWQDVKLRKLHEFGTLQVWENLHPVTVK